jgi:hypothetical protein
MCEVPTCSCGKKPAPLPSTWKGKGEYSGVFLLALPRSFTAAVVLQFRRQHGAVTCLEGNRLLIRFPSRLSLFRRRGKRGGESFRFGQRRRQPVPDAQASQSAYAAAAALFTLQTGVAAHVRCSCSAVAVGRCREPASAMAAKGTAVVCVYRAGKQNHGVRRPYCAVVRRESSRYRHVHMEATCIQIRATCIPSLATFCR